MSQSLNGRKALVTGGTRGIGYAVAEQLRAQQAEVCITGTADAADAETEFLYQQVNFAEDESCQRFETWVAEWQPDIIVNNAGVNKIGPFVEYETEDFQQILKVNLEGPFRITRAAVPHMCERKWGRIVNIGSVWGKIAQELRGAYSASKSGLVGMSSSLAAEVAVHGVLVNCVSPGIIGTEMTRSVLNETQLKDLIARVPAKRLGAPKEVARLVGWLVSEENTFLTGQDIAIDGGLTRV
jgi:NAD(P)-dependent dehydrogenase (short-subunit alcohol dehydrogenase family)